MPNKRSFAFEDLLWVVRWKWQWRIPVCISRFEHWTSFVQRKPRRQWTLRLMWETGTSFCILLQTWFHVPPTWPGWLRCRLAISSWRRWWKHHVTEQNAHFVSCSSGCSFQCNFHITITSKNVNTRNLREIECASFSYRTSPLAQRHTCSPHILQQQIETWSEDQPPLLQQKAFRFDLIQAGAVFDQCKTSMWTISQQKCPDLQAKMLWLRFRTEFFLHGSLERLDALAQRLEHVGEEAEAALLVVDRRLQRVHARLGRAQVILEPLVVAGREVRLQLLRRAVKLAPETRETEALRLGNHFVQSRRLGNVSCTFPQTN